MAEGRRNQLVASPIPGVGASLKRSFQGPWLYPLD
jgi:hypothetical protein